MRSEWGNIKECNKYPRMVLNIQLSMDAVGQWPVNDEPLNTFQT